MLKLVLENAEEPEIKLPIYDGSSKKQESSRKTSTSALSIVPKPLTVWSQQAVENFSREGNTRPPYLPPEKFYTGQEATVRTWHETTDWLQIRK